MSNLTMEDFEGFRAWTEKWLKFERAYSIGNPEVEVNFLGAEDANGDRGSLLIDVYQERAECVEYLFLAESQQDEEKCMILIFNLLQSFDYSLQKMLSYLKTANFVDGEMGACIYLHGLKIVKDVFVVADNEMEGR